MGNGTRPSLWEYVSPVHRLPLVRMVMALAAETNFDILRHGVPTGFIIYPVDELILVNMALKWEEIDKNGVPRSNEVLQEPLRNPAGIGNWHGTIDDFVVAVRLVLWRLPTELMEVNLLS